MLFSRGGTRNASMSTGAGTLDDPIKGSLPQAQTLISAGESPARRVDLPGGRRRSLQRPGRGGGAPPPDGPPVYNERARGALGLGEAEERAIIDSELAEISRRQSEYHARD